MKILIVGAGRIGSSVAESLVSEANDITVVDQDAERIGSLQSRFDLRGVVGNATSPQDRKSTRLNSSHRSLSRMPSSA